MTSDETSNDTPTERVFAEYLEGVESGDAVDFEAVCAKHPSLAVELRRTHTRWQAMSRAFTELSRSSDKGDVSATSSVSLAKLLKRLGSDGKRWQRYAIGHDIAYGGMGRVVRAWDEELRRDVAIKIHRHQGDERLQRRFVEEAQIAGQLDHPGIVPIHELGLDDQGNPFFAMKLVRGRDLGELLELAIKGIDDWSRTRMLNVFLRVCEAMAYAHDKGVVHRDLKPQNIMVGRFGETYVMDWGLARVVDAPEGGLPDGGPSDGEAASPNASFDTVRREIADELQGDDSALLTRDGEVVGTPAYMAPEQAFGESGVDPATDIYAVGAMLYHLLIGHLPFASTKSSATASQVLAAVKRGPPEPLPDNVPAELRAICDTAMARKPADRYASMMRLADDLRAFLESRVVSVYRTGNLAELGKWVVRNPALSISSILLFVLLLASSIVTTRLWLDAKGARDVAASEVRRGDFRNARLMLQVDNTRTAAATLWRQHLEGEMPRATYWALVESAYSNPVLSIRPLPTTRLVAMVPACNAVAAPAPNGQLRLLQLDDLALLKTMGTAGSPVMTSIAAASDAPLAITGNAKGDVVIWDLERSEEQRRLHASDGPITCITLLHDGFLTGDEQGVVQRWRNDTDSPQQVAKVRGGVFRLAIDPDQITLAIGADKGHVTIMSIGGKATRSRQVGRRNTSGLAFSRDGQQLWAGVGENIYILNTADCSLVRQFPTSNGTCRELVRLPDGTMATAGWWRADHFAADGTRLKPLALHGQMRLAAGPAGKKLAWSAPKQIGLIDGKPNDHRWLQGSGAIALSRDGTTAATWHDGSIVSYDVATGDRRHAAKVANGGWLRTDAHGHRVAVSGDGKATICDLRDGTSYQLKGPDDAGVGDCCIFSPDGTEFAVIAGLHRVERRRANDGELIKAWDFPKQNLLRLNYAPNGKRLAVVARLWHKVAVINLEDDSVGEVSFEARDDLPKLQPFAAAFNYDGTQLAVGNWRGNVRVRDLGTDTDRVIDGLIDVCWALTFSPTDPGLLLVSTGSGGITMWDLDTLECCLQMLRDDGPASQMELSLDGNTLSCYTRRGPVVIDLNYRERHVAGALEQQLQSIGDKSEIPEGREQELRAWARTVLEKPWPRWR